MPRGRAAARGVCVSMITRARVRAHAFCRARYLLRVLRLFCRAAAPSCLMQCRLLASRYER